jgi:hypothetical protein
LGDCEKITKDGTVPPSPHFWDPKAKQVRLHGGRNEVVAAQLILTARGGDVAGVDVQTGDLRGPVLIPADPNIQLFQEMYVYAAHAEYYNASTVLPQNKWYPEILAPFRDPYHIDHKPVGAPFDIKTKNGPNQGVWIDVYIPKDARPGRYSGPIRITVNGKLQYTASLELTVHDFTIPDETHVDGYGEFYGLAYEFHRALYAQAGVDKWWEIAKRYHQMAHQHRFVVMERRGIGPDERNWHDYDETYGMILDAVHEGTGIRRAGGEHWSELLAGALRAAVRRQGAEFHRGTTGEVHGGFQSLLGSLDGPSLGWEAVLCLYLG